MKNNIATLIVIVMLAVFALPAKAQQFNTFGGAVAPQASFQSTSTMRGSGSAYSSNPMINTNGTAVYNGAAASYGPHRAKKDDDEDEPAVIVTPEGKQPLGDAVLPLMLCALAYLIVRATRKRAKGERTNG